MSEIKDASGSKDNALCGNKDDGFKGKSCGRSILTMRAANFPPGCPPDAATTRSSVASRRSETVSDCSRSDTLAYLLWFSRLVI